jgi:hypothetical protein
MRPKGGSAVAIACVALAGCMPTAKVTIERLEPPIADVSGIKDVGVLTFPARGTDPQWGEAVTQRLASVVVSTRRFRVLKIEQSQKLLEKAGITYVYPPDVGMVKKIGVVLDVDAVLCGELAKFQFVEEGRLVKAREKVWTGDYVRDRRGAVVTAAGPSGEAAPRKRIEERMVEKNRLKRYAVVDIRFRMADAFVGNVICSTSESESGSWEGTGPAEIEQMPTREAIFDLLVDRAIKKFVRQIAPHPIEEERVLERGVFHSTTLGVELAKNNLWDEAVDKWLQATKSKPEDSAAYYNLGVAFERKGLFDLAHKAYQNALARNPTSGRYITAVARIQKLIKDLE